jgi:hypothetical protein
VAFLPGEKVLWHGGPEVVGLAQDMLSFKPFPI